MTYAMNHMKGGDEVEETVVVFNLGGGSLDVAVICIDDVEIYVEATDGDTHLGGDNFTSVLVNHCAAELLKATKFDIKPDPKALGRLRKRCEDVKQDLSTTLSQDIDFDDICN